MRNPLKRIKSYWIHIGAAIHSLLLIWITFAIMNSKYVHWDDAEIATFFHLIKNDLLGLDKKPPQEDFLFIDVSKSNELIDHSIQGIKVGNKDITNRKSLADFFSILNTYPYYKQVLCDIRFWDTSPHDSLLKKEIEKTPRLLCSTHMQNGKVRKPIFKVNYSNSDYENSGEFLKMRYIYNDSIKTTPLRLYELLHHKKAKGNGRYFQIDSDQFFNNFILEFRIKDHHYNLEKQNETDAQGNDSSTYKIPNIHLEIFLENARIMKMIKNKEFFEEFLKGKIIVLGDFSDRDLHETLVGELAGPAILINAYLALKEHDNAISWWFLIYLFICFYFISYIMIHPINVFEAAINKITKSDLLKSILSAITYFVLIGLISLFGYILFNFQFSIILLLVYVKIADWVIHMIVYRVFLKERIKVS